MSVQMWCHLINISVGTTADALDELVVVLRVAPADVGGHDLGGRGARHLMSRACLSPPPHSLPHILLLPVLHIPHLTLALGNLLL